MKHGVLRTPNARNRGSRLESTQVPHFFSDGLGDHIIPGVFPWQEPGQFGVGFESRIDTILGKFDAVPKLVVIAFEIHAGNQHVAFVGHLEPDHAGGVVDVDLECRDAECLARSANRIRPMPGPGSAISSSGALFSTHQPLRPGKTPTPHSSFSAPVPYCMVS